VGVASAFARLTEKQTRAQFMVQVARTCYEGLAWLWEKVRSLFVYFGSGLKELSVPSQIVNLLSVLKRHSKMLSGIVDTLLSPITRLGALRNTLLQVDSWASRYPRARALFEDIAFAAQCIVVAYGEEFGKRYTPLGFAALFGAVEALLETVAYHIDNDLTRDSFARAVANAAAHVVCHTILRLMPMWVAVPVHALYNYLVGRKKQRWWNELIELCRLDIMDYELDEFERSTVSVPMNLVRESKVYMKAEDGTPIYIKDDPEFLQMIAIKEISTKIMSVASDAARLLVKPAGSILDMVLMSVVRLDKPRPYEAQTHWWDYAMQMFLYSFVEPLIARDGYLEIYSKEKLSEYVLTRPWGTQRIEETLAIIRKWASECKLRRPKEVTPKMDEIIPDQPTLVEASIDDATASKTRPICPRAEEDLKAMAIAVPLKKWMAGQRFWTFESGVWEPAEDPEMELGFMLSIDYQMAPRGDLLAVWFNRSKRFHGLHFAIHGDDQYCLFVDVHGDMMACAIDLSMCDKSCAELYQKNFCSFVNLASNNTHMEDVMNQFLLLVGEFQLKSRRFPKGTPPLFWNKTDRSTNTGEPLTSVKAVFAQLPAIFATVGMCFSNGMFCFLKYQAMVMKVWMGLGLVPEFETCKQGYAWHHPSAVTYLGGMFVELKPETKSDWAWVSNKHIKAYMVFPAVEKIYGNYRPMEQHMLVLLQDPDLWTGPVGRALGHWFKRVTRVVFQQDAHAMSLKAQQKYENHLRQQDRFKLEQLHDNGSYKAISVSDAAFYYAADRMLERCGSVYCSQDIRDIVVEIQGFDSVPQQRLQHTAIPLYTLRFGCPKASTNDDEELGLSELNLVGAIFNLSAKIFTSLTEMTKSKAQKAKAKAMKQQNQNTGQQQKKQKKQQRQNPPQKRGGGRRRRGPGGGSIEKGDRSSVLQHSVPELDDIIEKDEFVADILGSGGVGLLSIQKFAFNPGQAALFPLGSAEAAKWTNWKCVYAEPYLLHEVSEFATDGSTGKVYIAADYNPANDTATTKQQLADMHNASCMPCEDVGLRLLTNKLNRADPKYVRVGPKPANADIRLYDGCNLYVAAIGQAGTTKVSELRIRYKFKMELPTLLNPTGTLAESLGAAFSDAVGGAAGGARTVPFSPAVPTAMGRNLFVNVAGSVTPPAGDYLVTWMVKNVFTGSASVVLSEFLKNAAQTPAWSPGEAFTAGTRTTVTISGSAFVNANGTDTFSLLNVATFTTGTNTVSGFMAFTPV